MEQLDTLSSQISFAQDRSSQYLTFRPTGQTVSDPNVPL